MSAVEIPAAVAAAAAQRQFGQVIAAQKAPTRRTDIIRSLLFFGVGALVLAVVLVVVSLAMDSRSLGLLIIVPLAVGVVCLGQALRVSLQQSQSYYLYQAGFVYHKGRRPNAIAWSEIARLTRQRGAASIDKAGALASYLESQGVRRDSVLGYDLALKSGGQLSLKVGNLVDEQAHFCAQLEQLAPRAGIPVTG